MDHASKRTVSQTLSFGGGFNELIPEIIDENSPEYDLCVKFLEATKRKPKGPDIQRHLAYDRSYSKLYRESKPEQAYASAKIRRAVRAGKLQKPHICSSCGLLAERKKIAGHHEDYSKPMEVVWLCNSCHSKLHKKENR